MNGNNTQFCTKLLHIGLSMVIITLFSCATQEKKSERPSPIAYDSISYKGASIKITYSSPGVKNRKIWNGLVPYFKIWRTGANEATVFSTNKDLLIEGDTLQAGKYALFTIPTDEDWTVILNKEWNQWGAYQYDNSRDALRFSIPTENTDSLKERMEFTLEEGKIKFNWEYLTFEIPYEVL